MKRTADVALVTWRELPELYPDDLPLVDALARLGVSTAPAIWDDSAVDWGRFGMALVRSTWDYHQRREEFLAWTERASRSTRLWNPPDVLERNTNKSYLRDLDAAGIAVVPTAWLAAGSRVDLAALLRDRDWARAVVKPAVSAGSFGTIRVGSETLAAGQAHLDRLLPSREMMVQPYLRAVETVGERSMVVIDGSFSHAVRKHPALERRPSPGEPPRDGVPFATGQADPEAEAADAANDEITLAMKVMRAYGSETLYARVDLLRDEDGVPRLMELELTEPTLFLRTHPGAADRLAAAVARRLDQATSPGGAGRKGSGAGT